MIMKCSNCGSSIDVFASKGQQVMVRCCSKCIIHMRKSSAIKKNRYANR